MSARQSAVIETAGKAEKAGLKVCAENPVTLPGEQDLCHTNPFVPPDNVDASAVLLLPPQLSRLPERLVKEEAAALFDSGLRGAMGRSIVARDLSISRLHLRSLQVQLDHAVNQIARGKGDIKRARFFADLLDRQHRRFVASADLLLRLDAVPTPSFRVQADQAAFVVTDGLDGRRMG